MEEKLSLEDAQKLKYECENNILYFIKLFQEKTGLHPQGISVAYEEMDDDSLIYNRVILEVKL